MATRGLPLGADSRRGDRRITTCGLLGNDGCKESGFGI